MHVQYASLVIDEDISKKKTKSNSLTRKSSKKLLDGKSFQKVCQNFFVKFHLFLLYIFILASYINRLINIT